MPKISVVLTVRNGLPWLPEAVNSILDQSFKDFELIVLDNASSDDSLVWLQAQRDRRLRVVPNGQDLGIAGSRNKGLELARAPYVAVMDADDYAMPERLAVQYAFMESHPEVTVCGGALSIYDAPDVIWLPPVEHEAIRAQLLFASCIYNPTVMYKKEQICVYAGGYDASMPPTEDYDLWARLSMNPDARFANLPIILCRYRTYDTRQEYGELKYRKANLVREKLLHHIGLTPTDKEFAAHLALSLWSTTLSFSDIWACRKWLSKLYVAALNADPAYDREALRHELQYRWRKLCAMNFAASAFGLMYFCSEFAEFSSKRIFMFIKSVLQKNLKNLCGKAA